MRLLCNDFGLDENWIIVIKNFKLRVDFLECFKLVNVYLDVFCSIELVLVVEFLLVGLLIICKNSKILRGR